MWGGRGAGEKGGGIVVDGGVLRKEVRIRGSERRLRRGGRRICCGRGGVLGREERVPVEERVLGREGLPCGGAGELGGRGSRGGVWRRF